MTEHTKPKSVSDLFISFSFIALQGFGGVLAIVQHELVERKKWLSNEEFMEDWAVAQILPGPNVVNLALTIGNRYFGFRGAIASMLGILCLPTILLLSLAFIVARSDINFDASGILRGLGAVAAGLIIATGIRLALALKKHPLGIPICCALGITGFVATALIRLPLGSVLLGIGGLGCVLTYRKLAP